MPTNTTTSPTTTTNKTTRQRRGSRPASSAPVHANGGPVPHPLSKEELQFVTVTAAEAGEAASTDAAGPPPAMAPPQAGTSANAGVAITGKRVLATWAEQTNRNAWAYLETAGWKKLSPLTDTGSTTMTLLAAHARATGSAPFADEDPAGTIGVLYVW